VATIICAADQVYDGQGALIENEENAFLIKDGHDNITIRNYRFKNVKYPVKGEWTGTEESNNIRVTDCEFFNQAGAATVPGSSTGAGILVYGQGALHNVTVENNTCTGYTSIVDTGSLNIAPSGKTISGIEKTWQSGNAWIETESSWGSNPRVWNIIGNTSDGSPDPAIFVNGSLSRIVGNNIRNCGKEGIKVAANFKSSPLGDDQPPVPNWEVLNGGHYITSNIVKEYGLESNTAVAAIDIQSPSCVVDYNTVRVSLLGAVSADKDKICYHYGNSSPFLISEYNEAKTLDDDRYKSYVIESGVVPGQDTSAPWPDGKGIKNDGTVADTGPWEPYDVEIWENFPDDRWIPWTTEATMGPNLGMGRNREGDLYTKLIYPYVNASDLPGQEDLWDEVGIIQDTSTYNFYTLKNVSQNPRSATSSGGRGALYNDFGTTSISQEVVWSGYNAAIAGPMVCVDPSTTSFGITFTYSSYWSSWILSTLGKLPTDVSFIAVVGDAHNNGDPRTAKLVVTSTGVGSAVLQCYVDGRIKSMTNLATGVISTSFNIESQLPELVNSTTHGISFLNGQNPPKTNSLSYAFVNYKLGAIPGQPPVVVDPEPPEPPGPGPEVPGCMDAAATNYKPNATVDDGSCVYPPPPPPSQEINYVDNVGGLEPEEGGDGTKEKPWKTLLDVMDEDDINGIKPGYTTICIDNGPTNPYRINGSNLSKRVYFSNKYGTAELPMTLKGDPNSNAYLRRDIDRPLTNPAQRYPNMYITQANVITGWQEITGDPDLVGVWETDNPALRDGQPGFGNVSATKSVFFGCPVDVWNVDGILGLVRKMNVTWRSGYDQVNPASDLEKGEFYMTESLSPGINTQNQTKKVYYKPKDSENMATHHFEIADAGVCFTMKRVRHMTFEGITIIASGSVAFSTDGHGVNRDITKDRSGDYQDDWCNDITLKNCYMKYTKLGTAFNVGENYLIDNCVCTDAMNGGFGYYGSKGNYDGIALDGGAGGDDRGFPVQNTVIQNSRVSRCRANDGIVWHSNSPYRDKNFKSEDGLQRIRWDDVGGNHQVINCVSSNNGENGFDITSGYDITLRGCTTHDNRHAGTTVAHYARNVRIYDQVSINDDTRRNFGGALGVGDARDLLVDNMRVYNPGLRFINITGDAQGIEIRNCTYTAGPDTDRSDLIAIVRGTDGEFHNEPRNNSTPVTRNPEGADVLTGIATTVPQKVKDIHIHGCTFNIPFGAIYPGAPGKERFKLFLKMGVLPTLGFNVKLENNVWNTSVLNTPWQPLQADNVDGTNYGPYTCRNTDEARGKNLDRPDGRLPRPGQDWWKPASDENANKYLYQPEVTVNGWQGYFNAGIFPEPDAPFVPEDLGRAVPWPTGSLWEWWPNTVVPEGREKTKFGSDYLANRALAGTSEYSDVPGANYRVPFNPAQYNQNPGISLNDTVEDLPRYLSAHLLQVQDVSYWDPITVEGAINVNGVSPTGLPYWQRTNWTIASPSSSGTSRAAAYKNIESKNVSAECRWSGDHKTSAGPMVCVNTGQPDFGLSLVWYAGTTGNDSFLALVEVGQSTQRNIVGISAPYPHTNLADGADNAQRDLAELRLRIVVENGLIRCYAGTGKVFPSPITIDNSNILPLIPLTTTEGGAVFSDTYSVKDNNPDLNTSTTHGVYLINNETDGSRTDSLKYARYPDSLIPLT
jgi:hypothetical protein